MDWIQQWQSKLNKQNGVAPLVRTGGSRHTGLAALPYRNIHPSVYLTGRVSGITGFLFVISPAVIGVLLFWLAYRFFHKMLGEYTGAGA